MVLYEWYQSAVTQVSKILLQIIVSEVIKPIGCNAQSSCSMRD